MQCSVGCFPGQFLSSACNASADRVCGACPNGSYCPDGLNKTACGAACGPGTFQTVACTSTTDRVCGACRSACESGYVATTECTSLSDRVCTPCSQLRLARCNVTCGANFLFLVQLLREQHDQVLLERFLQGRWLT